MISQLQLGVYFKGLAIWNATTEGTPLQTIESRHNIGVRKIIGAKKYNSFIKRWELLGKHTRRLGYSGIEDEKNRYRYSHETIHYTVRKIYEIAVPKTRTLPKPLKVQNFIPPPNSPNDAHWKWKGTVDGQLTTVREEEGTFYEKRVLNKLMEKDLIDWSGVVPALEDQWIDSAAVEERR
jgi:hypothetical protein